MKSAAGKRKGGAATNLKSVEEHAAVYAAVVASALDAVIVVDEEGIVVAINPAAETTFGYSRKEAMGKPIGALIVPDHLKEAHEKGFARYRATRKPHVLGRRVEMEARCKDGRLIPVELAITEVPLSDRRLFTANLRDLSAAREAMAEIERQRDALHQSEKLAALGSMLAGVAHELNNPLSIVLGQATMLREAAEGAGSDPAIRARAEKIEAAAERCARVVRSFLTIARQRKAETRAVALAPLLDSSIDLMLYGLRSSGVTVTREYDDSLPEILADPDQVQQIVVNLLVNAAQALEETEGRRGIRVSVRAAGDGKLGVVVADSGRGVPKEIAKRIFEPFFTTKPQGSGTGIGLSVSRGLAEAQGGTLALLTSPKGGGVRAQPAARHRRHRRKARQARRSRQRPGTRERREAQRQAAARHRHRRRAGDRRPPCRGAAQGRLCLRCGHWRARGAGDDRGESRQLRRAHLRSAHAGCRRPETVSLDLDPSSGAGQAHIIRHRRRARADGRPVPGREPAPGPRKALCADRRRAGDLRLSAAYQPPLKGPPETIET